MRGDEGGLERSFVGEVTVGVGHALAESGRAAARSGEMHEERGAALAEFGAALADVGAERKAGRPCPQFVAARRADGECLLEEFGAGVLRGADRPEDFEMGPAVGEEELKERGARPASAGKMRDELDERLAEIGTAATHYAERANDVAEVRTEFEEARTEFDEVRSQCGEVRSACGEVRSQSTAMLKESTASRTAAGRFC